MVELLAKPNIQPFSLGQLFQRLEENLAQSQYPMGNHVERGRVMREAHRNARLILSLGEADKLRKQYEELSARDPVKAVWVYDVLKETRVMRASQLRGILGMRPHSHIHLHP